MGVFDFLKSLFGKQPEPVDVYLLLFSASWCGPSKRFIKEIKEGGINDFTLVDVEANEDLAAKYNIRSVPTTILMKKSGEIIKKWVGYDDEDPGQKKFVRFIKSGNYNILPYAVKTAPKPQVSAPNPKPVTFAPKPKPYEIKPFTFTSNQHQRYENGNPVMGVQDCMRSVSVEKNTNGWSGYQLKPGDGYIVKAMNLDVNKPQMSPKPMRLISHSDAKDELRGYMVSAQTPFGWQDFDLSDYGLTIYYTNGNVSKVTLHMFDRNTDIEYLCKEQPLGDDSNLSDIGNNLQNNFSQQELLKTIKDLQDVFMLVASCETVLTFYAGMGTYNKELYNIWLLGSLLCEYYEKVYKFGNLDSLDIRFDKDKFGNNENRKEALNKLSNDWDNVCLMLVNLSLTGFPQDAVRIKPYSKLFGSYKEHLFPRLAID